MNTRNRSRGFTLVEIMFVVFLTALMVGLVLTFFIRALNGYYFDSSRLVLNRDVRKLTQDMTVDAVSSNFFRIYPSFSNRSNNGSYDGTVDAPVTDGGTGDFLVFFTETTAANGSSTITRIIAYYRDATVTNTSGVIVSSPGPVRRVSKAVNIAVTSSLSLIDVLNANLPVSDNANNPIVVQLAQGLGNGMLFYNYNSRSVIVRGQVQELVHGGPDLGNQTSLKTANTYNFTIAPRG
jgi:Tfp pilus assembly protein FimT